MNAKRRLRTRTEVARAYAETAWWRRRIANTIVRCEATGLDERSYAGLRAAGAALDPRFAVPRRTGRPFRSDRQFIESLVEFELWLASKIAVLDAYIDRWHEDRLRAQDLAAAGHTALAQAVADDVARAVPVAEGARDRLWRAGCHLRSVHDQLEETYQQVYAHVRAGRTLPPNARWITGEDPTGRRAAPTTAR